MAKDNLEQIINAPIYSLNEGFWDDIKKPYKQEVDLISNNC